MCIALWGPKQDRCFGLKKKSTFINIATAYEIEMIVCRIAPDY